MIITVLNRKSDVKMLLLSPLLVGFISLTFAVGQMTDVSQRRERCSTTLNEQLYKQLRRMQVQLDAVTTSTRQLVNLALHRPAWQSTLYGPYNASFAVDGNVDTFQHTDTGDWSPWWAVDLGKPTNVHLVNVINSRDCCPDRLDNIVVGLTNNPPNTMSPLTNEYATCGSWYGSAPKGGIMPVRCSTFTTAYRYVVVFGTKQHFEMAEVEVYEK